MGMNMKRYITSVGMSCPNCGHIAFITKGESGYDMSCQRCLTKLHSEANDILDAQKEFEALKKK